MKIQEQLVVVSGQLSVVKTRKSRFRRLRALWYIARPDRTELLGLAGIVVIVLGIAVLG